MSWPFCSASPAPTDPCTWNIFVSFSRGIFRVCEIIRSVLSAVCRITKHCGSLSPLRADENCSLLTGTARVLCFGAPVDNIPSEDVVSFPITFARWLENTSRNLEKRVPRALDRHHAVLSYTRPRTSAAKLVVLLMTRTTRPQPRCFKNGLSPRKLVVWSTS